MERIEKQIKAVMLGHAIGDALGVPVEFENRCELAIAPVSDMRGYGSYPVPAGAWSDDTSMSLAAMDVLSKGETDYFAIMVNFAKWLENGAYTPTGETFDVGHTCLKAIRRFIHASYSDANVFTEPSGNDMAWCGLAGEYDNGNGSLMRIHPFSLMVWFNKNLRDDFESIIEKASSLTHAHERSKLACKIYTLILFRLLERPEKVSVLTALSEAEKKYRESTEYPSYQRLFDARFSRSAIHDIQSSGYVVDTLEAAVWCLLTTESYEACVLKAVNLGSDTDTVAAIAGGLAGALYGYDAIPKKWLDTLIRREYIEEMCERAGKTWQTIGSVFVPK